MSDLILHCNSDAVTREQLAALPRVESTPHFQPIQHIDLVQGIDTALQHRGLAIKEEKLGLRRDDARFPASSQSHDVDPDDRGRVRFRLR